jgi:hypothetical protein
VTDILTDPWVKVYHHFRSVRSHGKPQEIEHVKHLVGLRVRLETGNQHYDDVYHAATYILWEPMVTYTPREVTSEDRHKHPWIHRGQCDMTWAVSPNIMRPRPGATGPVTRDLVRRDLRRTGAFIRRLQARRPDLDEPHAAAVAQHYSSAANIRTWLVDMTSDPFVALWFASFGGKTGQIGIVESPHLEDWNSIADDPENPLGPVRLLYPAGVPRLKAQHGLFLEAPNGAFWRQSINQRLTFRQHDGVVFEDPDIGVTDAWLMPTDDDLLRFAEAFATDPSVEEVELANEATLIGRLFADYTSPDTYFALARYVAGKMYDVPSPELEHLLLWIARFHATVLQPPWSAKLMAPAFWTIRRFVGAAESAALTVKRGARDTWRRIVEGAMLYVPEIRDTVRAAMSECEARWEKR